jgi:DNA polymerase-3 subunit alpha
MQSEAIVGIIPIGKMKAVDIEIDSNDHIFFANGIATSNSHSISYAFQAYQSAYLRRHHIRLFLKHWLRDAEDKVDPSLEIKQLVMSAKSKGIDVLGPSVKLLEENFFIHNNAIYFGICNVKNVGLAHLNSLKEFGADKVEDWLKMLFFILPNVNRRAITCLIQVGAFSHLKKSRTEMLHEFSCLEDLSEKELEWVKANFHLNMSLTSHLALLARTKKEGGGCHTQKRVEKIHEIIKRIENPGRNMSDNPVTYSKKEEELLGTSISVNELESCANACHANATCKEVNDGMGGKVVIACVIKEVKTIKTKKGDLMCFLKVEDSSGELENIVVFPKVYQQYSSKLYETSTLLISGESQKKENSRSFIVESIYEI